MRQARHDLVLAAVFCAALGGYDALYVWRLVSGGPLIGPGISAFFFPDFLVFQAAARAWVEGQGALIYPGTDGDPAVRRDRLATAGYA